MDMDWIRPIIVVTIPTIGLVVWLARWFGKHSEWVKGMEEFKQDTKETLAEIREDIKKLLAAQPRSVIAGASPMQLTDLGKEVSECVGAAAWAKQLAPQLIDDVKANTPMKCRNSASASCGRSTRRLRRGSVVQAMRLRPRDQARAGA